MCWTAAVKRALSTFRGPLCVDSCAMPKFVRFVLVPPSSHKHAAVLGVQVSVLHIACNNRAQCTRVMRHAAGGT